VWRSNRFQVYLLAQLAGPLLLFVLSLTGVVWLTQSLRSVDLIVNRGLSVGTFLSLTTLVLPSVLTLILPIGLFAAVLYAYQRLEAENELVAMIASGLSPWQLAAPALKLAFVIMAICYAFTLYLMPAGLRSFKSMQTDLRSDLSHVLLQEGAFNTLGDRLTVYIRERLPSGELRGILVHDSRDARQPVTMMASQAALVLGAAGPRLVMLNGNRQEVARLSGRVSLLNFDRYELDLRAYMKSPESRWLEPRERYLHELLFPTDNLDDIRNAGRLRAEAHDRLVAPLHAPCFTLIALAAVLGGEHNRRGKLPRLSAVVLMAVAIRLAGVGLVSLSARTPVLLPLLYATALLPAIVAARLLSDRRTGAAGLRPAGP
jgi:lipopolysaccharide export system permease protein